MFDYQKIYGTTKTLSVLLVEDFRPLRQEMFEVLEDLFQSVTCASDGKEALSLYLHASKTKQSYDLIISDIQMPNMNGVELSKKIRDIDTKQAIIILSAHTDSDYLLEFINIGISKFIPKPIDYDSLLIVLYEEGEKIYSLKSKNIEENIIYLSEGYTWDQGKYILFKEEEEVVLTRYESVLFQLFVNKKGNICTSMEILTHFQTHNINLKEKNIRNAIFKLRKKLEPNTIQSVYDLGYKMIF